MDYQVDRAAQPDRVSARQRRLDLRRCREISESTAIVMAGLVPAIHVVQLTKQKRFATISQLRSSYDNLLEY